eukprot:TRINITY_DN37787_c0_g1_i1.p1 TRINITY_DN37787_c0_g1~~TRINITY_DN37787_c0_g1_i1.p1  ORF type:complete len:147 (+),score=15.51 TRINITY_DN37787_c0_g1_i1:196-636(+)
MARVHPVQVGVPVRTGDLDPSVATVVHGTVVQPAMPTRIIVVSQQAPRPMGMSFPDADSRYVVDQQGQRQTDWDTLESSNVLCLQVGVAYACCCPCGLCVGVTLHCLQIAKPEGSPERTWGRYALLAGVCNVIGTAAIGAIRSKLS